MLSGDLLIHFRKSVNSNFKGVINTGKLLKSMLDRSSLWHIVNRDFVTPILAKVTEVMSGNAMT